MLERGKGAALAILKTVDMSDTHLRCDCPYNGRIAHMTAASMPGDRLHLQYAFVVCCILIVAWYDGRFLQ